jgi:rhodanese-related sulfurtransferase
MIKVISLIVIGILSLYGQTDKQFESYLQELTKKFNIQQIKADSVNLSKAIILDTRDKKEFDVSRIKNAIWIGYDDFDLSKVDSLKRDQEIIVYCSVGYRSSEIGIKLIGAGFTDVKNLYGGIFRWANEGRPLYSDSLRTHKIHAYNRKWGRFITNPQLIKVY